MIFLQLGNIRQVTNNKEHHNMKKENSWMFYFFEKIFF